VGCRVVLLLHDLAAAGQAGHLEEAGAVLDVQSLDVVGVVEDDDLKGRGRAEVERKSDRANDDCAIFTSNCELLSVEKWPTSVTQSRTTFTHNQGL